MTPYSSYDIFHSNGAPGDMLPSQVLEPVLDRLHAEGLTPRLLTPGTYITEPHVIKAGVAVDGVVYPAQFGDPKYPVLTFHTDKEVGAGYEYDGHIGAVTTVSELTALLDLVDTVMRELM